MGGTWCSFRLDGRLFGVDVARVQEVLRGTPVTPVPLAPAGVRGLINLRGQIVTAVDLRVPLGLAPDGSAADHHVVVHHGHETVTLLVDTIEDVLRTEPDQFEPCPDTLRGAAREMIRGCCVLEHELLLILDLDRALEAPTSHGILAAASGGGSLREAA
jgi:purine-binding chemotaxis protein CheW